MFDLVSEIAQTLRNNKLRTSLTGFAVAWGIFMLIVLLGMTRGVINSFNEGRMSRGTNTISVWGGSTSMPYKGYKEGRKVRLEEKDLHAIESDNHEKVSAATSTLLKSGVISTPKDYISSGYNGVYPTELNDRGLNLVSGRFINDRDLELKRKVIVLTKKNCEVLFEDSTKVLGNRVVCEGLSFTVVGIIDPEFGQQSYIPFSTAMMMNGNDGKVSQINVNIKNVKTMEDGEEVEKDIRSTLARRHEFNPDDQSGVWIWNRFTDHLTMNSAMSILDMVIWLIGIFTMLSGIVGVSNIMFVSVRERTHEIGIRRAIGARPRNILTQILTESIAITALFGYIGVFLGIVVTELLDSLFGASDFLKNPTIDISIAVKVTLVLIVSGCLAGLFPALKALKVKPVEALRDE